MNLKLTTAQVEHLCGMLTADLALLESLPAEDQSPWLRARASTDRTLIERLNRKPPSAGHRKPHPSQLRLMGLKAKILANVRSAAG